MRNYIINLIIVIAVLLGISGCSSKPEPIKYGVDVCDHCKMTIVDKKWGSEIITQKGKIYKFDVVECMIGFLHEHKDVEQQVKSLWTVDFTENGKFIDAGHAVYVRSLAFHSPMGLNAVSLADRNNIGKLKLKEVPDPITYSDLKKLVFKEFGYDK